MSSIRWVFIMHSKTRSRAPVFCSVISEFSASFLCHGATEGSTIAVGVPDRTTWFSPACEDTGPILCALGRTHYVLYCTRLHVFLNKNINNAVYCIDLVLNKYFKTISVSQAFSIREMAIIYSFNPTSVFPRQLTIGYE